MSDSLSPLNPKLYPVPFIKKPFIDEEGRKLRPRPPQVEFRPLQCGPKLVWVYFTKAAKAVIESLPQEATRTGSDAINLEHLTLSLLTTIRASNSNADITNVIREFNSNELTAGLGLKQNTDSTKEILNHQLDLGPHIEVVLEKAKNLALRYGQTFNGNPVVGIGTLLLALSETCNDYRYKESNSASLLKTLGIDFSTVRKEINQLDKIDLKATEIDVL